MEIDSFQRYQEEELHYSICTLVTRWDDYHAMLATFRAKGFVEPECEFLYLDNSTENRFDGFSGVNLFLSVARGRTIIVCHQDVRLINDDRPRLDEIIATMDRDHPHWGILGNAGGTSSGDYRIRITDPHGSDIRRGPFPALVRALDENFLLIRRSANLALSADVGGYHLYGTDLCVIANILGYGAYVVDFHLNHLSPGKTDDSFTQARGRMVAKYRRALAARWITSTCTTFLAGGDFRVALTETKVGLKMIRSLHKRRRR